MPDFRSVRRPQCEGLAATARQGSDNSVGQGWRSRLLSQWRALRGTPLRTFPASTLSAVGYPGVLALPGLDSGGEITTGSLTGQAHDLYSDLGVLRLPPKTLRSVHAFLATLPSWLSPPLARRCGEVGVELTWQSHDGRRFRARIDGDGMVVYSARLGDRGRLDAAEPIGERLSPIVLHSIRQLAL